MNALLREAPIQVIESAQSDADMPKSRKVSTIGSVTWKIEVTFPPLHGEGDGTTLADRIPDSFLQGLEECEQGRVVDLDQALTKAPPASAA